MGQWGMWDGTSGKFIPYRDRISKTVRFSQILSIAEMILILGLQKSSGIQFIRRFFVRIIALDRGKMTGNYL